MFSSTVVLTLQPLYNLPMIEDDEQLTHAQNRLLELMDIEEMSDEQEREMSQLIKEITEYEDTHYPLY